jgi:hypothetical protein
MHGKKFTGIPALHRKSPEIGRGKLVCERRQVIMKILRNQARVPMPCEM